MKIQDIFRRPIGRMIEEVIKVDLADEDIVALELDEYVATDHILDSLEEVLDAYQETILKPSEVTNVWVSGSSVPASRPMRRCSVTCWRTRRFSGGRPRSASRSGWTRPGSLHC